MNREQFLATVRAYIETDPEAAAYVSDYVQAGLSAALSQANERAADMEVALSVLAAKRYKGADEIVKGKLRKWHGKTSLKWDWLVPVGLYK
jgi:Arc/MetJ-type ribon-helix-helix transcriptional regulator